ncbi:hypothetical protein JB92DRAFT_2900827 [Gautieria morchelliformis]|nr:hypothetical protein JB92DRAFT_2900827 [Gautieria morchelliformis]
MKTMYLPMSFVMAAPVALALMVPQTTRPWSEGLNALPSLFGEHASLFAPSQYLVVAQQYFMPEAFDFWNEATKLGNNLKRYTDEQLENASATYTSAKEKIEEFKVAMAKVVSSTREFGDRLGRDGLDFEELFATELNAILDELKTEFSHPLPGDETPRQAQRDKVISSALSKVENVIVNTTGLWGVPEETSRLHFQEFEPHVKNVLFVSGQLIDEHPVLMEIILFTGATLLIPEAWLLRPLLRLFGFGPSGPVKGSAAAWLQREIWGAAVSKGSWFARLQAAGMKSKRGLCKTVVGSAGVSLGIGAAIWGSCC